MSPFARFDHPPFLGSATSVVRFVQEPMPYDLICQSVAAYPATAQSMSADLVLEELAKLKPDWDGYGALPIAPEGFLNARTFLARTPRGMLTPEISPTSNGTISLEWESGDGDAYLEIGRTRFSGHIQPRYGSTVYVQGYLTGSAEEKVAAEQVLAVIDELLYGSLRPKTPTHSIQVPESAL